MVADKRREQKVKKEKEDEERMESGDERREKSVVCSRHQPLELAGRQAYNNL